jgi:hypothetical protein
MRADSPGGVDGATAASIPERLISGPSDESRLTGKVLFLLAGLAALAALATDDVIDLLVEHANRMRSPLSAMVIEFYGGAPGRVGPAESAFAQRRAEYNVGITAQWTDPADSSMHIAWARETYNALEPYSSGHHLLNFQSEAGDDVIMAAFGNNYVRLAEVKRRYDPANFFSLNQNIQAAAA